jgi:predicted MFS family arabinose efflux permease
MSKEKKIKVDLPRAGAISSMAFIVLMSIVSMFSDMTLEGANSINGAFESFLGASALVVSVVGGVGSLLGFCLRFFTGWLADRTKHYWTFTFVGYAIDLAAIPLLALVPENGWILAVTFLLMEKVGKAIKKPSKDTIFSFAASSNGTGKSFAFCEALDQIGATIGPMILTLVYLLNSNFDQYHKYKYGYLFLLIPASMCILFLIISYFKCPHPDKFERDEADSAKGANQKKAFTLFIIATGFLAVGFPDAFGLISKHLSSLSSAGTIAITSDYLPLLYSFAMFIDAISAVIFGLFYDKKGFISISISTLMAAGYAFFIFLINTTWSVFVGLAMWGVGMGAIESVMKSGITDLSLKAKRASSFGTYEVVYGLAAFGGSFLIGWLYDASKIALATYTTIVIVIASVIYLFSNHEKRKADALYAASKAM